MSLVGRERERDATAKKLAFLTKPVDNSKIIQKALL